MKIAIITPVRDEASTIGITLDCLVRQTLLPARWIVVDDGSTDGTGEIVREYARRHPFIEYLRLADRGYRLPARGVIEAFNEGCRRLAGEEYEVIAKLDGDLELPPDALEKIAAAFRADPRLGITGGTRYERRRPGGAFRRVRVPPGFVGGPYKFYRRRCFEEIGGLVPRSGWDGADIVRAEQAGWRTGELADLEIRHLKPTGMAAGEGVKKVCLKYGSASWYLGGYPWYFGLKALRRAVEMRNPWVVLHMLRGYLGAGLRGERREPAEFRRAQRRAQLRGTLYWLREAFGAAGRRRCSGK